MCSLVRDRCSLTGIFRCRGFRCLPVAGEPTPGLPLREAPCSSSIIIDLGHEGLELLSSIHSHKTPLLSFTAPLTANCISRRPNCTGTFQCHSNNEHAIPRDRSSDKLGRGSRSSGYLAVVVVLLFAHLRRTLTAAAGPPPRDPYRHALTMRPPRKVRPVWFLKPPTKWLFLPKWPR